MSQMYRASGSFTLSYNSTTNELTITTNSSSATDVWLYGDCDIQSAGIYFVKFLIKGNYNSASSISIGNNPTIQIQIPELTNNYQVVNTIQNSGVYQYFRFNGQVPAGTTIIIKDMMIINLTKMFGSNSGIVSALGLNSVSEITDNNGNKAIEAFESLFPSQFYAYDPGSLLNVNPTTLRTVGFNQFNPSDKYAHVLGGMKYEVTGTYGTLSFKKDKESSTSTAITVSATTESQSGNTIDSYQGFTPESDGWVYASAGNDADTNIHLVWSGYKNGSDNYEPYWQSNLDLSWIRSIEYNGQALFPDGLKGIGDVHDEVTSTKAIKRIGSVDMGDLTTWNYDSIQGNKRWYAQLPLFHNNIQSAFICPKFEYSSSVIGSASIAPDYTMALYGNNYVYCVYNTQITTSFAETFRGTKIYYVLQTPIEVTFDEEKSLNYREDDFGTEWLLNESSGSTVPGMCKPSDVSIMYQTNLRDYLRNLPSELDTRFDSKANTQGYYPDLQVGLADNIYSPDGTTDNDTWLFRTSAGNQDIGTGFATLQKLEGQSIVWNQMVQNGNFADGLDNWEVKSCGFSVNGGVASITFTTAGDNGIVQNIGNNLYNHKLFITYEVTAITGTWLCGIFRGVAGINMLNSSGMAESISSVVKYKKITTISSALDSSNNAYGFGFGRANTVDSTMSLKNAMCIDLTQMFGSDANICAVLGVSNLTDSANLTLAASNFEKLFPADYYPYSEPKLLNFNPESLDTVGFNLYNPETGTAELPGETGTPDFTDGKYCYQITGTYTSLAAEDGTSITPNANGYFNVAKPQTITVVGGNETDTCIHLCWSGYRNGDYEAYEQYGMNLSWIRDLEYTPEGETEAVKLFPDGLKGIGDVVDEVTATKAIKRIGSVDLGTYPTVDRYSYSGTYAFRFSVPHVAGNNTLTTDYTVYDNTSAAEMPDKSVMTKANGSTIYIRDDAYSTVAALQAAKNGSILYYELATPIEVTFDQPKTLNYRVNDFGTEKFTAPDGATAPGQYYPKDVQIKYQDNLRDKVRNMEANFVSFTTDQTESATESQKAQARENIGMPALLNEKANVNGAYPQLTAGNLISDSSILRQFYYDKTAGEGNEIGSGHATVNQVRGNTIVWNQLGTTIQQYSNAIITDRSNGRITVSSESANTVIQIRYLGVTLINGHKYIFKTEKPDNISGVVMALMETTGGQVLARPGVNSVYTSTITTTTYYLIYQYTRTSTDTTTTFTIPIPTAYDLTQMFGSGKEPTASQFFSMFPSDYYPYNEGTLISCGPTSVVSRGANFWDGTYITGYYIDDATGEAFPASKSAATDYIKILPGQTYYIRTSQTTGMWMAFYDYNKTFITGAIQYNRAIPSPANAYYMRCTLAYNKDIINDDFCVSISTDQNGTYFPYQTDTLDLSWISELTYTPEGASEPVQMFPNGLCSAGTVYDEVTPTKAIKRLTTYTFTGNESVSAWTSQWGNAFRVNSSSFPWGVGYDPLPVVSTKYINTLDPNPANWPSDKSICCRTGYSSYGDSLYIRDNSYSFDETGASQIKSDLIGETIIGVLATPIEIPLTKSMGYAVQPGGTEQLLPENQPGTTPTTSQIIIDVTYPLDSVGTLQNLKRNYMSEATLTSLITALNAINTNMSWKASRAADGSLIIAAN